MSSERTLTVAEAVNRTRKPRQTDRELEVMNKIVKLLGPLDVDEQIRIAHWLSDRYGTTSISHIGNPTGN